MAESAPAPVSVRNLLVWVVLGVVAIAVALLMPVNLKSVTPPVLREAGKGGLSLVQVGVERLDLEKLGAAQLVLAGAGRAGVADTRVLEERIQRFVERRPEWVPWGGWDPFLDPVFSLRDNRGRGESTPVLDFLVTDKGRAALRVYLSASRSPGVQDLLEVRKVEAASSFVPVARAGGQALDSVLLLVALVYQADGMSPALQREVRELAVEAVAQGRLAPMEPFLLDMVSLGRRLNWGQLVELLKVTRSVASVSEFAQLARAVPDDLALIYAAAMAVGSADWVASYLMERGQAGLEDVRFAAGLGAGALNVLLRSGLPVNRVSTVELGAMAEAALMYPRVALVVRYGGFLLAAYAALRALEAVLLAGVAPGWMRMRSGVLALVLGGLFIVASEPFLLRKLPLSEFRAKLSLPVLASVSEPVANPEASISMDTKTVLSVAFFAALQVVMYLICLRKIREVDRQPVSATVKLRLMRNEDNLFDGGLYIGIGGTATALVMQVLGVIEANLLAAYSSNLFGIVCVAMVKIRNVRPFTRRLILEAKDEEDLLMAERREGDA